MGIRSSHERSLPPDSPEEKANGSAIGRWRIVAPRSKDLETSGRGEGSGTLGAPRVRSVVSGRCVWDRPGRAPDCPPVETEPGARA